MPATLATTDPSSLPKNITFPLQAGQIIEDWALVRQPTLLFAGQFSINETFPSDKRSGQILHGPLMVASIPLYTGAFLRREYSVIFDKQGKIGVSEVVVARQGWLPE